MRILLTTAKKPGVYMCSQHYDRISRLLFTKNTPITCHRSSEVSLIQNKSIPSIFLTEWLWTMLHNTNWIYHHATATALQYRSLHLPTKEQNHVLYLKEENKDQKMTLLLHQLKSTGVTLLHTTQILKFRSRQSFSTLWLEIWGRVPQGCASLHFLIFRFCKNPICYLRHLTKWHHRMCLVDSDCRRKPYVPGTP